MKSHARIGGYGTGLTAVAIAAIFTTSARACPPRYTIEVFDGPGNSSLVYPAAINSSGVIVGDYQASGLADTKAFQWSGGPDITLVPMPPGAVLSNAYDIADDGTIVGNFATSNGGGGFLRIGNATTPLGVPAGAVSAKPSGVNSAHVIVGQSVQRSGVTSAFRWVDGKFENLTPLLIPPHSVAYDISESGFITGATGPYEGNPGALPFLLQGNDATILSLPKGAYAATGFSVSQNGMVCGEAYYPGSGSPPWTNRGFIWSGGSASDVGAVPGDEWSRLFSVNSAGEAVGVSWKPGGIFHGVVWTQGALNSVLDLIMPSGIATRVLPRAINDAGQMAADANLAGLNGVYGVRLTPVPPRLGDIDCNFVVNIDDLLGVINAWGPCGKGESCSTDLNHDMAVNTEDLVIVLKSWDF